MSGTIGSAGTPGFGSRAAAVTKSDDTVLDPCYIFVGGAGTVVVDTAGGDTDVSFTMPAGLVVPVEVVKVKAASTATLMVRLW